MWPFDNAPAAPPPVEAKMPAHPFYPLGIEVTNYLANEWGVLTLLSAFAACCASVFAATYVVVMRVRPTMSRGELLTVLWFVLCGCIHTFFEGYVRTRSLLQASIYVFNFRSMGNLQSLFGQLWKEYSLSDSRYLTKDPFVLCMESITAICWGPLSFLVAYMVTMDSPLRHPLQIIVSLGQLYGDVLYYATSMFDHYIFDIAYCRPEPYYFWCYYFLMNFFWIVIPLGLLVSSVKVSSRAMTALKAAESATKKTTRGKKAN